MKTANDEDTPRSQTARRHPTDSFRTRLRRLSSHFLPHAQQPAAHGSQLAASADVLALARLEARGSMGAREHHPPRCLASTDHPLMSFSARDKLLPNRSPASTDYTRCTWRTLTDRDVALPSDPADSFFSLAGRPRARCQKE